MLRIQNHVIVLRPQHGDDPIDVIDAHIFIASDLIRRGEQRKILRAWRPMGQIAGQQLLVEPVEVAHHIVDRVIRLQSEIERLVASLQIQIHDASALAGQARNARRQVRRDESRPATAFA